MKKILSILFLTFLLLALCSCTKEETTHLKIGYISQSTPENDSLTSAIWDGITKSCDKNGYLCDFICKDNNKSYEVQIKELYDDGCRIIVSSDYALKDSIKSAAREYSDCTFVCIGYTLSTSSSNIVNVTFSEHELGFMAGIASSLKINKGNIGAILGMDLPSTSRLLKGLELGINYSNQHFGTDVHLDDSNAVFMGSYNDPQLAETVATQLYKSNVKCILTDGGSTGEGVFNTAKKLRGDFPDIWVLGTEIDKYHDGVFLDSYSVTLTSIIYLYENVINDITKSYFSGTLNGSGIKNYGIADFAIGFPNSNPNLPPEIYTKCDYVFSLIQDQKLVIPNNESLFD